MGTVLLGAARRCVSLAVRQRLCFQHNGASTHYEDVWQWLKVTYPLRWSGCQELTVWFPQLLDLTPMSPPVKTPEGAHLWTTEDLMARLQATVTTANANMNGCV
jgi:hypothetical protein